MKRKWNWLVWTGFGVALVAALSYIPVFALYPATRDFPWVNLLLFLVAGAMLGVGMRRAFAHPDQYRGKIGSSVVSVLSLALFGLFCFGVFYAARILPSPAAAVRVGQRAPDFSLAGVDGKMVTLSQLLQGKRAVLLIFYRGYW